VSGGVGEVVSLSLGGVVDDASTGGVCSCCGGSWTGTFVSACRRGGIIETDWVGGARIRRRRELVICFTFGLEGVAGEALEAMAESERVGCNS
jgi:hypothetical protein